MMLHRARPTLFSSFSICTLGSPAIIDALLAPAPISKFTLLPTLGWTAPPCCVWGQGGSMPRNWAWGAGRNASDAVASRDRKRAKDG